MKVLFFTLILAFSFTAFAGARAHVECDVSVVSNHYLPIDFDFVSNTEAHSYLVIGTERRLLPKTEVRLDPGQRLVFTAIPYEGSDIKIAVAFEEAVFKPNGAETFMADAVIDGRASFAICSIK